MKNIILFLIITILSLNFVFAETQIELNVSDTQINIDDYINLEIKLIYDWDFKWWNVSIIWVDNFKKLNTKNGSSYSNINWTILNTQTITLSLAPYNTGSFIIWPAILWENEEELKSNIVEIKVLNKKIKSNSNILENKNNIKNKDQIQIEENENNMKNKDWIEYDYNIFSKFNYYFLILLFVLIIIVLYFLDKYNNKPKKQIKKEIIFDLNLEKKKIIKKLNHLKKNNNNYTKPEFYSKLNIIFRYYFNILWFKDSDTLTLKEIKVLKLDKKLVNLFEKSYLSEFNNKSNFLDDEINIIDDLINILK